MARKTQLLDVSKCTACRGCQCACKNWNQLAAVETEFTGSYENPPEFKPTTWTRVAFIEREENEKLEWMFIKKQCMHCGEAACVEVCPVDAISYTDDGFVIIDYEECIACGACVDACPFQVPRIDEVDEVAKKCTLCFDRVTNDFMPSCQTTCPVGVMSLGDRNEMLALGEERVAALKEKGYDEAQLYGIDEEGGLGTVYVLAYPPDVYGFPEDLDTSATVELWKMALRPVRMLAAAGLATAVLAGWFHQRREQILQEVEKSD